MRKINKNALKESFYLIYALLFISWALLLIINFVDLKSLADNITHFLRLSNFRILTGALKIAVFNLSSIFWFFIILTAAAGIGKSILGKFKLDLTLTEKIVYSIALGFAALSYAVLLAGALGILYSLWIKGALLFLFVLLVWKIKPPLISIKTKLKTLKSQTDIVMKLTLLALLPLITINLIMSLSPEISFDALVYHLAAPNYYIIHNAVKPVEYIMHSNFPSNQQMLYTLALLTGNEITAKAVHSLMYFLIIAVIFSAFKKAFGFKPAFYASAFSAVVYVLSQNSWRCGNDTAAAFYFCLALSAALNYIKSENKRFLYLSFIFAGLTGAVKYTGIYPIAGLIAGLLCVHLKLKKKIKIITIVLLVFLISLPVLPWLLKNYIFTGNPVYPFFYGFIEDYQLKDFGGGGRLMSAPLNIFTFNLKYFFTVFWEGSVTAGIPNVFYVLILPFLLLLKFKNKYILFLTVSFAVSYFLWFLVSPDIRYLLPSLIFFAALAGLGMSRLAEKVKWFSAALPLIITLVFFQTHYSLFRKMEVEPYFKGEITKAEYLSAPKEVYPSPPYAVINWLNKNLSQNSKILFIGETRSHYIERDFICYSAETNRQPLMEFLKMSFDEKDFYNLLKKRNITHLFINYKEAVRIQEGYNHFYWTKREREIFNSFWENHINLLTFKYGSYLYEIKSAPLEIGEAPLNILEFLSESGWTNRNLSRIYYENSMYDSLIDDMNIYEHLGADLSDEKNKIKELKKSGGNYGK